MTQLAIFEMTRNFDLSNNFTNLTVTTYNLVSVYNKTQPPIAFSFKCWPPGPINKEQK